MNKVKRPKFASDEDHKVEADQSDVLSDISSDCDSDTEHWNDVIKNFYNRGLSYKDDPNPYELREGYDCTNPKYPDRRWQRRVETNSSPPKDTYPQKVTSGDKAWWEGEVPFPMIIEAEDYTQDRMMDWLYGEQDSRDDWDTDSESDICVSLLMESETDDEDANGDGQLGEEAGDWE